MDIQDFKIELGNKIKSYREKKGYTQEKFGEIINLDQSNLSNIENGKNFPDITTVYSIIKNAGAEPNFLFGYTEDDNIKYSLLDYEIIDLLKNLPEESKIRIKNIVELINFHKN